MSEVTLQVHPIMKYWRLQQRREELRVAVEFTCGCCCKKARNAALADVVEGILVLEAREGGC